MIIESGEEVVPIVIINTMATEEQENEYKNKLEQYENGIILLNDRIIYKNEMLNQNIEYKYQDIADTYQITEFTKEEISDFIANFDMTRLYSSFFFIITIYMFILYFTSTLVDAFMLAVLGFIVARIIGIKIKFKASFNMGVYALTLPIILNLIYIVVNAFTGFYVKYFQWMYTTISYIYMIVAILIIKTDLINKQIELMKIIEEQEKVKKELEEKEKNKEEEQKKELKDTKEPEEKNKNDKEKDDGVGDNGLAPQE